MLVLHLHSLQLFYLKEEGREVTAKWQGDMRIAGIQMLTERIKRERGTLAVPDINNNSFVSKKNEERLNMITGICFL